MAYDNRKTIVVICDIFLVRVEIVSNNFAQKRPLRILSKSIARFLQSIHQVAATTATATTMVRTRSQRLVTERAQQVTHVEQKVAASCS